MYECRLIFVGIRIAVEKLLSQRDVSFSSSEVEGQCRLLNDKEEKEEERNEQLTTTEQSEVYRTNEELSSG